MRCSSNSTAALICEPSSRNYTKSLANSALGIRSQFEVLGLSILETAKTSLTNKVFLLNDIIRKIPDIKITIKRERGREDGKGTCECV